MMDDYGLPAGPQSASDRNVEITLCVLILALIGCIGYWVYAQNIAIDTQRRQQRELLMRCEYERAVAQRATRECTNERK
ncbi:MAG TPA: hypothetical protein VJ001_02195 [Rhodocyclaceae bacterium]|nr:hypothetical protein [Rhodocyclaceae bacterium]